ncbi:di-trans,poly-cis-decaprenylcistransferase [Candidatus Collierbacteria bacterium RIFOXYB2_FULL_46_14]|uniref:Isoprenyl transferase n=1 Tax=Candidatus Collierbacteria bacterium GW2011_GWA2_46_26 TaxID=1618381 RepID=A0A0G1PKM3_9BACT|nr:MAG: Isoprenyl transferase [Candidatus Collierbacteria bacterium GW2011_GWC2_44_13]KKU33281.1 MAG: Isoprenyl transferase [Candidatus Collierbacteria bacterium GW2011_GWA2_46_26]OGD72702.1 MAG: di-trans,poly-cis-decaprenylcistransferase [Candidatus Collierbacteria bacterium RIFOXYB2_FULL_46_14]OGD75744.1 MAG: di-trans,poly-cis-decaprenylcistransferase [Candidatus Collierbacteria bacterium RIFOXYA2_FULL_46_20]OGD77080.1 MAG: di-trans,poly-cis-decaprenylcistransferase [Candidatus Collierbacteri
MATLPKHIAIMMDGNRRWARTKGLDPVKGHEYAANHTIEPLIEKCADLGIPYVTFWAFSTENWKREEKEVQGILEIFRLAFGALALRFISKGAKLHILGDMSRFPKDIVNKSLEMIAKSSKNNKITVSFALNYGGRDEIVRAVKKIVAEKIPVNQINEEAVSTHLDTAGMPDPDLVIRTGGERRTSGYLPWQSVYSELYFTPILFPDFTPDQLMEAINDFSQRDRRFGGNSTPKTK